MKILLTDKDSELLSYLDSKPFFSHHIRTANYYASTDNTNPARILVYVYELNSFAFKRFIDKSVGLSSSSYQELYYELHGKYAESNNDAFYEIDVMRKAKVDETVEEMIKELGKETQWQENYRDYNFAMTIYDKDSGENKTLRKTMPRLLISHSFYFSDDTYLDYIQNDTMNLVRGEMKLPRFKIAMFGGNATWHLRHSAEHSMYISLLDLRKCEYSDQYFHEDCDYITTEDGYDILNEYTEHLYLDSNDYYYYDEDNFPEQDDRADTFSYHAYGTQDHESYDIAIRDNEPTYFVGYEIEKDDYEAKSTISAMDLIRQCKFRKEEDSSIDSEDGYELISPRYKFDLDIIKKDIETFTSIQELLDAEMTSKCGMHVSLSHSHNSTSDIFKKLVHWLPLFYGLYPSRVTHDYCLAKKGKDVSEYVAKYSSIYVTPNRLEMRIFPSVYSSKQLLWRLELVKMVLQRPISGMQGLHHYITSGEIKKHLLDVYSDNEDRITSLYQRAERFAVKYQLT